MQNHQTPRRLYLISWLTDFVLILLIFTVGRHLAESGMGTLELGLIGGGFSFCGAVSSVLFGWLSDRIGRHRLIVCGCALMLGCSLIILTFHHRLGWLLPAYWLSSFGVCMIYSPLIAWLNQGRNVKQSHAVISQTLIRFCLAWNLGIICAQFFGGWLFELGLTWPLMLASLLAGVNLIVVTFLHRHPSSRARANDLPKTEKTDIERLSGAFAKLSWIANVGHALCISMMFHLFPQLVVALNVPANHHGMILAIGRFVTILVYFLMHHSRFWHYRFSTALGAQVVAMGGLVLLATTQSEIGLTLGVMGLSFLAGYNYFASIYYSSTGGGEEKRGLASGLHEATLGAGFAIGSIGGGIFGWIGGIRAPYLLAIALLFALTTLQIVLYYRRVRPLQLPLRRRVNNSF